MTSDESTNLWIDAPCHDRAPSLSPYRQYSTARFSFSRSDECLRLGVLTAHSFSCLAARLTTGIMQTEPGLLLVSLQMAAV